MVGPFLVPILKRLGLGLADIFPVTEGIYLDRNGIRLTTVGSGFIHSWRMP